MNTFASFDEAEKAVRLSPFWSKEEREAIKAAIELSTTVAQAHSIWFRASDFLELKVLASDKWASLCETEAELRQICLVIPWHFDAAQVIRQKLDTLLKPA
jgi:hypothetical protein